MMARKKAFAKGDQKSSSTGTSTSTSAPQGSIPVPFEPAPERLRAWLSERNKALLYLTHMDANPIGLKKQVFAVPVLLNLFFVALLAWRIRSQYPWYTQLIQQVWDLRNATNLKDLYSSNSVYGWLKQEVWNCISVCIDYTLLMVVAPWPWSFYLGRPGNPVLWRYNIWFRERELIVRASRGWDVNDLLHGEKKATESPFFVTRVFPSVSMDKISKTGYLLMDKDWDLDFHAMTTGQLEIDADKETQKIHENAFNGKMFGFWKPSAESSVREGQWVMWNYRRDLYEKKQDQTDGAATGSSTDKGDATEGRRAVELFQAKLTEMGKEDLFFKWIELIHYESSRPGGFTKERQIEAGAKVKQLFEEYQVDFEKFEQDCGIVDGQIVD